LKVRLIRKLAEHVEGIDLRKYRIGDLLDLPAPQALLLIAHGCAVLAGPAPPPAPAGSQNEDEPA
jgi:hypothetical protein